MGAHALVGCVEPVRFGAFAVHLTADALVRLVPPAAAVIQRRPPAIWQAARLRPLRGQGGLDGLLVPVDVAVIIERVAVLGLARAIVAPAECGVARLLVPLLLPFGVAQNVAVVVRVVLLIHGVTPHALVARLPLVLVELRKERRGAVLCRVVLDAGRRDVGHLGMRALSDLRVGEPFVAWIKGVFCRSLCPIRPQGRVLRPEGNALRAGEKTQHGDAAPLGSFHLAGEKTSASLS